MVRVQVLMAEHEREDFRRRAAAEGLSLSAWLREAGRARSRGASSPALRSVDDLRTFFAERAAVEQGTEPDWQEHRAVIGRSRRSGGTGT